ncbi:MAG: 16S rRNA processing protein RimM [Candidatus Eisenbacteria bacterium RBG_16_71_46]|nr:MAG: 16S rRNA processing protein RimM [Candidatus Eisenbacteria bacterium RBG_16_71_46]OGF24728.1 MAG: 16S rRNA processing protein RimM [Candidatus Eisenbacteria bacterium RBG_19FT_COMBO_70_11]
MSLVRIGRVGRAHGLRGELTLDSCPLEPGELLEIRDFVWRGRRGETRTLTLEAARAAVPRMLARFAGVADREGAVALASGELWVERERLPDPGPGVAYTFQLLGLRVETDEGRMLGTLEDIIQTGAHPVYVVRGERELMIPAAPEVLKRVDLAAGVITVVLPAGLEDL